jgi:hypothetical protein
MNKVYIRKRWLPAGFIAVLLVIYVVALVRTALDHLDRLNPDWIGLSRTAPFFAYAAILIVIIAASATHIRVTNDTVSRYHTPLPFQPKVIVPVKEIEQVLFWQTSLGPLAVYGMGLQTRSGKRILHQLFRTRDEVFREVRRVADALGSSGLTTVKVAETRAAVSSASAGNIWIPVAALVLFAAFYRLAKF